MSASAMGVERGHDFGRMYGNSAGDHKEFQPPAQAGWLDCVLIDSRMSALPPIAT